MKLWNCTPHTSFDVSKVCCLIPGCFVYITTMCNIIIHTKILMFLPNTFQSTRYRAYVCKRSNSVLPHVSSADFSHQIEGNLASCITMQRKLLGNTSPHSMIVNLCSAIGWKCTPSTMNELLLRHHFLFVICFTGSTRSLYNRNFAQWKSINSAKGA